jgi:plastocyanin
LQFFRAAPAHPASGCSGAFVLLLALLCSGCENSPLRREKTLDIGGDTITLERGVRIVDVRVGGQANPEFAPVDLRARVGDVVRFTTADSRTHLIDFDTAAMPPAAKTLFASKTQLRSPPLLVNGTIWIVSLAGAAPGDYTFHCRTHEATGRLTVK